MNISDIYDDELVESTFLFGGEIVSCSGVRAVAASIVLSTRGDAYDLEDPDAPYELRGDIGKIIGNKELMSGLFGGQDIPRYWDYLILHAAHGSDWPMLALTEYMERHGRVSRKKAQAVSMEVWKNAMERYAELRTTMAREAKEAMRAARKAA